MPPVWKTRAEIDEAIDSIVGLYERNNYISSDLIYAYQRILEQLKKWRPGLFTYFYTQLSQKCPKVLNNFEKTYAEFEEIYDYVSEDPIHFFKDKNNLYVMTINFDEQKEKLIDEKAIEYLKNNRLDFVNVIIAKDFDTYQIYKDNETMKKYEEE